MKNKILTGLLALTIACPLYALAADINTEKAKVQQKYDEEKDKVNTDFQQKIADAQKSNDTDKVQRLAAERDKKLQEITDKENLKLQKLDQKANP